MDDICQRRTLRSGFTLMEVVVAVAVLGVAISIFVSLYSGSLGLAQAGKNRSIAATLAEGQLNTILNNPQDFLWETNETDGTLAIRLGEDDPAAGNNFDTPSTLPLERRARDRQVNEYDDFRWTAFSNRPSDANYVEVTIVIHWTESGREDVLALSSALQASRVPEPVAPTVKEEEEATESDDATVETTSEEAAA